VTAFNFLYYLVPPFLYAALIFYLSNQSDLKPPVEFKMSDKLIHVLEFGMLSFLVMRAIKKTKTGITGIRPFVMGMAGTWIYAISDEIHQYFVPGRSCSLGDIIADGAGIFIAGFLFIIFYRKLSDKH
jgi:VanZ family protein